MTGSNIPTIDADAAVTHIDDDAYGFAEIAKKLCPTILQTAQKSGVVIGIEGPWGSGKTTLLSFLRKELRTQIKDGVSIIEIAPWLLGNIGDLPQELFSQMATKLLAEKPDLNTKTRMAKGAAETIATRMQRYGAITSATASVFEFVGNFSAPIGWIGKGIQALNSTTDKVAGRASAIELKRQLEADLKAVEHRFIVLVDDLDRLEPAQATEVLRLVKSVANFPSVTFVMCYDRQVLSEAIEKGLQVSDGHSYIQKIVQVAFGMPFFEPFALRTKLKQDLLNFYTELGLPPLDPDALSDFSGGIDQQGSQLKTPRDVKAVVNRMRLLFPSVASDTYFPDFVRLQLIQVLQPKLYDWLQLYLNERGVIENGDGRVSEAERTNIGERLEELLPEKGVDSTRSIYALTYFIPGVQPSTEAKDRVFKSVSSEKRQEISRLRRLGSPFHYKFYFALASPSSVLNDEQMAELLTLAAQGWRPLSERLKDLSSSERLHGQSWLVHAAQRLSLFVEDSNDTALIGNVALAMVDVIDGATLTGMNRHFMLHDITRTTVRDTVDIVMRKLGVAGKQYRAEFWSTLLTECSSVGWIVEDYLRRHLYKNGEIGERPDPPDQQLLTSSELQKARDVISARLSRPDVRSGLLRLPELASFMFGWRELLGKRAPTEWVKEQIISDDGLVTFLLGMRYQSISDKVYFPLKKTDVEDFIAWKTVETRLKRIEQNAEASKTLKDQVQTIRDAIAKSRYN